MSDWENVMSDFNDALVKHKTECGWLQHPYDDHHDTECGNAFTFNSDGPLENNFNWCPYCGKRVRDDSQGETYAATDPYLNRPLCEHGKSDFCWDCHPREQEKHGGQMDQS